MNEPLRQHTSMMFTRSELEEVRMQAEHDAKEKFRALQLRTTKLIAALRGFRLSNDVENVLRRFENDLQKHYA